MLPPCCVFDRQRNRFCRQLAREGRHHASGTVDPSRRSRLRSTSPGSSLVAALQNPTLASSCEERRPLTAASSSRDCAYRYAVSPRGKSLRVSRPPCGVRRDAFENPIFGRSSQVCEASAREPAAFTNGGNPHRRFPCVVDGLLQRPAILFSRSLAFETPVAATTPDAGNNTAHSFAPQRQATPARCTAALDLHLFFLLSLVPWRAESGS